MEESVPEQVLLDENEEAKRHSFYIVRGLEVSPNHQLLGYGVDTVGGEKYVLHFKDIKTGKSVLAKPIPVRPCTQGLSAMMSGERTSARGRGIGRSAGGGKRKRGFTSIKMFAFQSARLRPGISRAYVRLELQLCMEEITGV